MTETSIVIAVGNVRESSKWYQYLLGCSSGMDQDNEHRDIFDLLDDEEGRTVIVLSEWDHNPLAPLQVRENEKPGHGVVLLFKVGDFEDCWKRAEELGATVISEPHPGRGFHIPEFTIVDPDGYYVTISAKNA